jgi:hypothetical protein
MVTRRYQRSGGTLPGTMTPTKRIQLIMTQRQLKAAYLKRVRS